MEHWISNRSPGLPVPLDGQDIHPSWCDCDLCTHERRHAFRLDLVVIVLGIVAGLFAAGTILLLGIK